MDRKTKVEAASGGFVSDTLQRKLKDLEEENLCLRSEVMPTSARKHNGGRRSCWQYTVVSILSVHLQANHLKSETETYEEKEQQLVNDCVKELSKSLHSSFFRHL